MFNIENIIFTKIKYGISDGIKAKYPDLNFTTDNKQDKNAKFPNVYIHMLGSPERGQDLEGTTINAVYCTVQVEITDNQSQKRAKEVMEAVLSVIKGMRFEINLPETQNTDDVYRCVARCSRIIGAGDIL